MYIIDVKRTPIGKFLGSLSNLTAPELTKPLFSHFFTKYPYLQKKTDEVIIGNVLSAGIGMNPARIAAFSSDMGENVPAYTINHVCASGMNAVIQGHRVITTGEANLVIAGGMESMSQAPYLIKNMRKGVKFGSQTIIDSLQHDGLYCSLSEKSMGITAETIARKYKIGREAQDRYAMTSHEKAIRAQKEDAFSQEIISVNELHIDENPRSDTTIEKLSKLNPAFKKNGTITAGNSSTINDGAALAFLASHKAVKKYGLQPQAKIIDTVFIGLEPELMGIGPKYVIKKLLKRNSLHIKDIDIFEINEAFAAQVLAVIQELEIDISKVNIHGGAIAIGHPIGMSGTRIIGSLITSLKMTHGNIGIAVLCVGGGQGAGILIKNI